MFKNKQERQELMKAMSSEQIEEVNDEYYSDIEELSKEFDKYGKEVKRYKIDDIMNIIEIS